MKSAEAVSAETTKTKPAKATAKPVKTRAKAAVKAAGAPKTRKPRAAPKFDTSKLDAYGFRLGSLKAKAAAMYASKTGATLSEVRDALNSTQFNLLNEVKERGWVVEEKSEDSTGKRRHIRYFIKPKK